MKYDYVSTTVVLNPLQMGVCPGLLTGAVEGFGRPAGRITSGPPGKSSVASGRDYITPLLQPGLNIPAVTNLVASEFTVTPAASLARPL